MSAIGRVATPLSIAAFATAGAIAAISRGSNGSGNQVVGAEARRRLAIGERDDLGGLGLRELGDRAHGRELHRLVDRGGAAVERAAENEREAQRRC